MGLSFLTPMLLAGLALLAVPILVHLVRRPSRDAQRFPSLMFIPPAQREERQRRTIRHWLLLLLRCLALALVVLAFARPLLSGVGSVADAAAVGRDVVIALDVSYSMGFATRRADARQAALDAVDGLEAGERAAVVAFDDQAIPVHELSADRNALRAAIEGLQTGVRATDLGAGITYASEVLSQSPAAKRTIVLISDFQRAGHHPESQLRLPRDVELQPVIIDTVGDANLSFASAELSTTQGSNRTAATATTEVKAQIRNDGDREINKIALSLMINGRQQDSTALSLAPGATGTAGVELPAGRATQRVSLQLPDDALVQDNTFNLVVSPPRVLSVLIIEPSRARRYQSVYLTRAFELATDPPVRVERRSSDALKSSDIDDRSIVILNDAPLPRGVVGERLRAFVDEGGGLLIAAGDGVQDPWPAGDEGYLPGALGPRVEARDPQGASIVVSDRDHPVFEVFRTLSGRALAGIRASRYRELAASTSDRVIARYDDGAIALLENGDGNGRVLVLSTTLDAAWSNLPLEPAFVPLVHQIARYLAGYETVPSAFQVGDVVDVARYARALPGGDALNTTLGRGASLAIKAPSGHELRLAPERTQLRLDEPGFYEIHHAGAGDSEMLIAVNTDPAESDLTVLDVPAFITSLAGDDAVTNEARADSAQASSITKQEEQQQIWWYLLVAAMVMLGAETLLSNRLSLSSVRP